MPSKAVVLVILGCLLATGCRQLERLTLVRPSAHSRGYTQVAPRYDVDGKNEQGAANVPMLLAAAADRYQRGELDEAKRLAGQAIKAQPGSADGNTLLGLIAAARGERAAAGRYYKAAVSAAPANGVYANNYGGWLCDEGRAEESLAWFQRALADPAYPTPLAALVNAGDCARKAGQLAQAEVHWRRALELEPANLSALAGLAALASGQGDYFEARAFVERWLAVAPADAAGLRLAATIEQKLGDNAAAARYLSRLQAISPGSTQVPRTQ